jgi:hypothetical protein
VDKWRCLVHLPGQPFHSISTTLHEFCPLPLALNPVTLSLNGHKVERFTPGMDLAAYDVDLPVAGADLRGDVTINLESDTFVPRQTMGTNDDRALGLFVDQIKLTFGPGIIIPPLLVWALLMVSVVLVYAIVRTIGLPSPLGMAAGMMLLVAQGIAVVAARMWIARNSVGCATLFSLYVIALRLKSSSGQRSAVSHPLLPMKSEPSCFGRVHLENRLMLVPILGADVVGTAECCPYRRTSTSAAGTVRALVPLGCDLYGASQDGYQYAAHANPRT